MMANAGKSKCTDCIFILNFEVSLNLSLKLNKITDFDSSVVYHLYVKTIRTCLHIIIYKYGNSIDPILI